MSLQNGYFVAFVFVKDVLLLRYVRYALTLLRWELRYRARRIMPRFARKFYYFVRYDLVELLVILGFAAVFVAIWAWYFA